MWKIIQYVMIGNSHLQVSENCQDFVSSATSDDTCVIVLADGAGSVGKSLNGAQTVSLICAKWLVKHFDEVFNLSEHDFKWKLKNKIDRGLLQEAKRLSIKKSELSSTLLFVAINNKRFISCHIGDGVIGVSINDSEEVLSSPERGEFANNTFFTTSPKLLSHIRIQKGAIGDINSFYLMSDGSADCLYLSSERRLAPAVRKLSASLSDDKSPGYEMSSKLLKDVMENLFRTHTSDDCSFIMVQWQ